MAGKSGFGSKTTAEEATKDVNASGLTAIVTGATGGIGKETARVLALRGARVFLGGRSVASATAAKDSIAKEVPDAKLDILAPLDLGSQSSIRACAKNFLALNQPLNLLINNAGVMMCPYELTEDGIEKQFGTNHIGHFLLTNLLLDKLKETADETGIESRIVNVSSRGIERASKNSVTWKTINDKKGYSTWGAYGTSKIANVYHAQELTRRLRAEGVTNVSANSLHPGVINTDLGRYNKFLMTAVYTLTSYFWKSIPQGAATSSYLALHPDVKGVSGEYFYDCQLKKATDFTPLGDNEQAAKDLWDVSLKLTETHT